MRCLVIIYFSVFIFAVVLNKKKDSTIWHSSMHKFPWAGTCAILASAPPSPTLPRFQNTVPIIHAPRPKHARPDGNQRSRIFSWRSGLSQEYQIEHYQPSQSTHVPSRSVELPQAAALPVIRTPGLSRVEADSAGSNFVSSFYPLYMQQAIVDPNSDLNVRPEAALASTSTTSVDRVVQAPPQAALPPSPPPLGNWPRADILSQPVSKVKRKPIPISQRGNFSDVEDSRPSSSIRWDGDVTAGGRNQSSSSHGSMPMRPVGPRTRSGSHDTTTRPPSTRFAKS